MAITLVVEDGSGLSNANCYCDEAYLANHAELLGEDLSSYNAEQQKSAIWVAANKYIDRLHDFKGERVQADQGMKLYTDLVTFADAGKGIQQANAEAAILELKGFLFVSAESQSASGDIKKQKTKLDALEEEIEYVEGSAITIKYNTSAIDELLKPYLESGSGGVALRVT